MRHHVKIMQLAAKAVAEYGEAETGTSSRTLKMGVLEGVLAVLEIYGIECVWGFEGKACHLDGFYHQGQLYDTEGNYVRTMPQPRKD